jgi:hypothetical protein
MKTLEFNPEKPLDHNLAIKTLESLRSASRRGETWIWLNTLANGASYRDCFLLMGIRVGCLDHRKLSIPVLRSSQGLEITTRPIHSSSDEALEEKGLSKAEKDSQKL